MLVYQIVSPLLRPKSIQPRSASLAVPLLRIRRCRGSAVGRLGQQLTDGLRVAVVGGVQ